MHKKRHSLCFSLSLSFLTALSPPLPLHSTPLTRAHLPHKCTFHTSTSLLLFPRNHISKHGLFHRLCSLRHRRPYPHQGQRRLPALALASRRPPRQPRRAIHRSRAAGIPSHLFRVFLFFLVLRAHRHPHRRRRRRGGRRGHQEALAQLEGQIGVEAFFPCVRLSFLSFLPPPLLTLKVPSQQASAAPLATLPPLRAPPTAPSPSSPSPRLLPLLLPRAPSPPPPPTSAPATTLSTLSPALKTGPTARQPAPTSRRPSPPLLRPLSRAPPPSSPPPRARPFLPLLPLRLRSRAPARATARCGGDSPLSLFVRFLPSLSSLLVPHSCLFLLSYHSYLFLQTRVLISAAVALETKRSRKIASTKTTMRGEPASATTAATVPSLHRMRRLPLATPPFLSTAQHEGKNERKNGELEIAPYYC
jgi:hypothetical protein